MGQVQPQLDALGRGDPEAVRKLVQAGPQAILDPHLADQRNRLAERRGPLGQHLGEVAAKARVARHERLERLARQRGDRGILERRDHRLGRAAEGRVDVAVVENRRHHLVPGRRGLEHRDPAGADHKQVVGTQERLGDLTAARPADHREAVL